MSSNKCCVSEYKYSAALALVDYINMEDECFAILQKATGNEFGGHYAKLIVQSMSARRTPQFFLEKAKQKMLADLDTVQKLAK